MPRWEPEARDRLRDAALELFLAHGYDNVTVAQITERAGLTRRTFSRYFTDKRDVLFAGSEQLPGALAAAVERADQDLVPFAALLAGLAEVGDLLADQLGHVAERRAIVQSSPELQERGRTKFAAVTSALAGALERRGAQAAIAELLAQVGAAIFWAAFGRWAEEPEHAPRQRPERVRQDCRGAHFCFSTELAGGFTGRLMSIWCARGELVMSSARYEGAGEPGPGRA
jgi:AcrR family transcriptional regulator